MKRWLAGALLLLLCGCADDIDSPLELENGLYAYYGPEYVIAIGTDYKEGWNSSTYCEPGYISITKSTTGAAIFNQSQHIAPITQEYGKNGVAVSYSGWSYENGLIILCVPKSNTQFTGVIIEKSPGIELPGEVTFNKIK